jgi:phosphoribosylformylglycinamidine (FGAM) synthase PurS component
MHVLQATERAVNKSLARNPPGHPRDHDNELIADVQQVVIAEITRLKVAGNKQHGAKTAIKNIVKKVIADSEIRVQDVEVKSKTTIDYMFRLWEAGRKRG